MSGWTGMATLFPLPPLLILPLLPLRILPLLRLLLQLLLILSLEQEREGQMAIVNPSQLVAQHPFPEVYLSCPDEREAQAVLRVAWRLRRAPLNLNTFLSSNFFKKLVGVLLKERLLILNANAF